MRISFPDKNTVESGDAKNPDIIFKLVVLPVPETADIPSKPFSIMLMIFRSALKSFISQKPRTISVIRCSRFSCAHVSASEAVIIFFFKIFPIRLMIFSSEYLPYKFDFEKKNFSASFFRSFAVTVRASILK